MDYETLRARREPLSAERRALRFQQGEILKRAAGHEKVWQEFAISGEAFTPDNRQRYDDAFEQYMSAMSEYRALQVPISKLNRRIGGYNAQISRLLGTSRRELRARYGGTK